MKDNLQFDDEESRLSDSLVLEAIEIATNEKDYLDEFPRDDEISRKLILSSITETAAHDEDLRDRLIRDDELSNDLIVRATRVALKRRKHLGFYIKPVKHLIPKALFKTVPVFGFLDMEIAFLSFLDAGPY